jgi:hypothetical protein
VSVEDDDVAEAVLRQPFQHLLDEGAVGRLGDLERAGVRLHAAGDAVGERGRDHGIDARGDLARHRQRRGDVGAVVDDAVGLQRPRRQEHGLHLRRHRLLELHPVDALQLALAHLRARRRRAQDGEREQDDGRAEHSHLSSLRKKDDGR